MAAIETSIDDQLDLTIHAVSGDITLHEITEALDACDKDKATSAILWDFTFGNWSNMTSIELQEALRTVKKSSRQGGKTALVFAMDVEFGLSRVLEAYAEMAADDFEFTIFRSRAEAEKWLARRYRETS